MIKKIFFHGPVEISTTPAGPLEKKTMLKIAYFGHFLANLSSAKIILRSIDGKVIFRQTLLVLDQFGFVLSISELRNVF